MSTKITDYPVSGQISQNVYHNAVNEAKNFLNDMLTDCPQANTFRIFRV